jgi:antitoxin ParD1/3/4
MTSLNIALPDPLREFVDEQVATGGFPSASEYIQCLLQDAQTRAAAAHVEAALLEGLDSGPASPMTAKDWAAIRRKVAERLPSREQA